MSESWLKKYAPQSFDSSELIAPEEERHQFIEISEGRMNSHILLSGTPGTGKSSICNLLLKCSKSNHLFDMAEDNVVSRWQKDGDCWQKIKNVNQLDRYFLDEDERNKRPIERLIILEEFEVFKQQSLFKRFLDEARDTRFIITTNHLSQIDEAVLSRCVKFSFGRESELWMNDENDVNAGERDALEKQIKRLIRKILTAEAPKSRKIIDDERHELHEKYGNFFINIIKENYPSIRDILSTVRKYVINEELRPPERLMK